MSTAALILVLLVVLALAVMLGRMPVDRAETAYPDVQSLAYVAYAPLLPSRDLAQWHRDAEEAWREYREADSELMAWFNAQLHKDAHPADLSRWADDGGRA